MKNKLYVMCGCPGSGKSTYCKERRPYFGENVRYISRDDIRFSLVNEGEEYFSHENEVFKEYIENIKQGLRICDATIADATHLNRGSRTKLFRNLGTSLKGCKVIAVVIRTPLEVCLERNEKRVDTRAYVPVSAIKNMYESFTMPTFEEGFDEIVIVDTVKNKTVIKTKENERNRNE